MAVTFYAFRRTVTTSGTPVQLDTFAVEPDQAVLIKAKTTNTGVISIGNSSAEALTSNAENWLLPAGQSVEIKVPNTNAIWIDSTVNGDIVEVLVGGGGGSSGGSGSGGGDASEAEQEAQTALLTTIDADTSKIGDSETAGADAASNTANSQRTSARLQGFNGTTWDRIRAGISGAVSAITGFLNNLPFAQYLTSAPTLTNAQYHHLLSDLNGNLKITLGTLQAGEDLTNNVMKVEQRFAYSYKTADGQVKGAAGFVHAITFACTDAAPTAGSIIIYDSLTETGTVIYSETFDTTAFRGFTVILDVEFATGLYVGFTTTADIGVTVSYR